MCSIDQAHQELIAYYRTRGQSDRFVTEYLRDWVELNDTEVKPIITRKGVTAMDLRPRTPEGDVYWPGFTDIS